jgi:hypothetical protein
MSGWAAPGWLPVARGTDAAKDRRSPTAAALQPLDARRTLQLCLAGLWLLDGVLQLQPFMFTAGFGRQVLAAAAAGNPAVVAGPIRSIAHLVAAHPASSNAEFAGLQILLGLSIAWRPTVKLGLATSIGWALAVWWLGEGLGGVLSGTAGVLSGGPGAALLYALLAVAVWPPAGTEGEPALRGGFVAAGRVGSRTARTGWLGLWAALGAFSLVGGLRSPRGLHDLIADTTMGQPHWIATLGSNAADLVANRGPAVSIGIAVGCAAIALGVLGPPALARVAVVGAVALVGVVWLAAQSLGGMFGGQATDPGSGPLLILLAISFWPPARPTPAAPEGPGQC